MTLADAIITLQIKKKLSIYFSHNTDAAVGDKGRTLVPATKTCPVMYFNGDEGLSTPAAGKKTCSDIVFFSNLNLFT